MLPLVPSITDNWIERLSADKRPKAVQWLRMLHFEALDGSGASVTRDTLALDIFVIASVVGAICSMPIGRKVAQFPISPRCGF